jgi:hypothetical protein
VKQETSLIHAGFLLSLLYGPEDESDMFHETWVDFYRITRRSIPEDRTLLISNVIIVSFSVFITYFQSVGMPDN